MKTLPWAVVLPVALGVVVPSCSKQPPAPTLPPSPPTKLMAGGWKGSWSPDGRQLVYGQGPGLGLDLLEFRSQRVTPLVTHGKDACWSPDGRWIAFVREEGYNNYRSEEVWVVDPAGKDPRRLGLGGFPSWSRDGKKLFVHSRQQGQVLQINPDESPPRASTFFSGTPSWYLSVAPDETRVAFGCAGRLEIRDRTNGTVAAIWPTPGERGLLPAWSPDGKWIAFGGFDGSRLGLWVLEVEGMKAAQIVEGNYTMPVWNRDGSALAFDSRGGDREIWTVARSFIESKLRSAPSTPAPAAGGAIEQPPASPSQR